MNVHSSWKRLHTFSWPLYLLLQVSHTFSYTSLPQFSHLALLFAQSCSLSAPLFLLHLSCFSCPTVLFLPHPVCSFPCFTFLASSLFFLSRFTLLALSVLHFFSRFTALYSSARSLQSCFICLHVSFFLFFLASFLLFVFLFSVFSPSLSRHSESRALSLISNAILTSRELSRTLRQCWKVLPDAFEQSLRPLRLQQLQRG